MITSAPFRSAFPVLPHRSVVVSIGIIVFVATAIFVMKGHKRTAQASFVSGYAIFWIGRFMPQPFVQFTLFVLMTGIITVPILGIAYHANH